MGWVGDARRVENLTLLDSTSYEVEKVDSTANSLHWGGSKVHAAPAVEAESIHLFEN